MTLRYDETRHKLTGSLELLSINNHGKGLTMIYWLLEDKLKKEEMTFDSNI